MIDTILNHILILILTLIGLFTGAHPELELALAGLLMVLVTYESFQEKPGALCVLQLLVMALFAVLSGCFACFVVFFLFRAVRESVRLLLGVCLFCAAALVLYSDMSVALCAMQALLLVTVFLFLMLMWRLLEQMKEQKMRVGEKIMAANVSELHEKRLNEQLVMQNFLAQRNARLEERETISRNIHNSVGHSITAAILTLDAADVLYDVRPEEARKRMNDANCRIRGSLESIRRAVRILDEDSAEISASDLKCDMENIIHEFVMDTNICVEWNFDCILDEVSIPHDHAGFLTGALQEMLTNGVKHGRADRFAAFLTGDSAHIRLEVSDNGCSDFDASNAACRMENGFGLRKMVSYAERCGGKAAFVKEGGFKATVELPLVYQEEESHDKGIISGR